MILKSKFRVLLWQQNLLVCWLEIQDHHHHSHTNLNNWPYGNFFQISTRLKYKLNWSDILYVVLMILWMSSKKVRFLLRSVIEDNWIGFGWKLDPMGNLLNFLLIWNCQFNWNSMWCLKSFDDLFQSLQKLLWFSLPWNIQDGTHSWTCRVIFCLSNQAFTNLYDVLLNKRNEW